MPIEVKIETTDGIDILVVDGHPVSNGKETLKAQDVLDLLEWMGYITIKIEE